MGVQTMVMTIKAQLVAQLLVVNVNEGVTVTILVSELVIAITTSPIGSASSTTV
jgi:S-adenosylmethionine/arginine decarboxylase-like enzyme